MHFSGKIVGGFVLILVGLLLLEDTIGFDFFDQLFPLLLIGAGIAFMVRRRNQDMRSTADSHSEKFEQKKYDFENKASNFTSKIDEKINKIDSKIEDFDINLGDKINNVESKINDFEEKVNDKFNKSNFKHNFEGKFTGAFNSGKVKYEKAFGDLFVNCKGVNVQNMEVSSAIGDIEIQLRDAVYVDGLNRLIISNFIGDVHIYVPKEIPIFANCSNFIGDIEAIGKRSTGFGNKIESHTDEYDNATRKLYIACNSFLGDIRIISV